MMDIKNYVIRWLINAVGLLIVSKLMASIEIDGILTAVVAAAVIGVINIFLRPILIILTLPINILSLGLFTLVIKNENEGSGLELSLSDFLPLLYRLTDGSIVDSQVIRNLFQRIPISNVSKINILVSLLFLFSVL